MGSQRKKSFQIKSNTKGIILSGGPLNVYQLKDSLFDKTILKLGIPILGMFLAIKFYQNLMVVRLNNLNIENLV